MASVHSASFSDADVILTRLNVSLAKRQGLLASLVGVGLKDEHHPKPSPEVSHQDEDNFSAEPELLGIGGKIPDDEGVDRQRTSSNQQLKRQLLGRDYEKRQKAKHELRSTPNVVSSPSMTMNRGSSHKQQSKRPEVDSEEEAGRSSLGKRKRNRPDQADKRTVTSEEAKEQDEKQSFGDNGRQLKSLVVPSSPQPEGALQELCAEQTSGQRNRKKKKRKKQRHQGIHQGDPVP